MRRITVRKENDSTSGIKSDIAVISGKINPNVLYSGPHISVEVVTGRCANSGEKKKKTEENFCYEESFYIPPPPPFFGNKKLPTFFINFNFLFPKFLFFRFCFFFVGFF